MLEIQDVSLLIPGKPQEIVLLGDVCAKIPPGHFVAVVGPSGCGKSTLLKIIAGISEPTLGKVMWKDRDLAEDGDLDPHEIGYVPQFSIAYDLLTVEENISITLKLRVAGLDESEHEERVRAILEQVGLEKIADREVRVLSGGQRRRLALALEMATAPALLLCDEVTSGLDPKAEDELVSLLRNLARDKDRTVLSVTHSLTHLSAYDTVLVLVAGKLAYHGSPEFLTHYFQIDEPAELYPQLALRTADEWHQSWKKHREAFEIQTAPQTGAEKEVKVDPLEIWEQLEKEEAAEKEGSQKDDGKSDSKSDSSEKSAEKEKGKEGAQSPEGVITPDALSQFATLLRRRWLLFFRDPSALWLQLALILGFPCLVVIFALDGLPQIQNLSMKLTGDVLQLLKDNAMFSAQASRAGSLVSGLVMFQVILLTLMASNNAAREIAGERLIFEKEKFGGLQPIAYVASKAAFLFVIVLVQSIWMGFFVNMICRFPGDLLSQIAMLTLVNGGMTAICLAISSMSGTAEQASLISIYLVGFQLPLSGAVLALPEALGFITRPFIAAYWGWSGFLQTLKETRFYDVVTAMSQTSLSPLILCIMVLGAHVVLGLVVAVMGCRNSRWPN